MSKGVKETIPDDMKFVDMCEKIKSNAYIYKPKNTIFHRIRNRIYKPKQEIDQAIEKAVNECQAEYDAKVHKHGESPRLEMTSKYKLGYTIMDLPRVGERGLKLLIS